MHRLLISSIVTMAWALSPAPPVSAQRFFAPQEGHWSVEGESGPGSGLNLTVQGGKVGVTVFTFDAAGEPRWFIAVAELEGTRFSAELQHVIGGTRIQDSFSPGEILPVGRSLSLDFSSETTAVLTIDGVEKRIRLLQFGNPVVTLPALTEDGAERRFPELSGAWAIWERNAEIGDRLHTVEFAALADPSAMLPAAEIGWSDVSKADAAERISVFCFAAISEAPAATPDCLLRIPLPGGHRDLPLAANDIGLTRFAAKQPNRGIDGLEVVLAHALRVPLAADRMRPVTGHYAIPGENGPGSGINLVPRSNTLGLTVFTYNADGNGVWFTAAGEYPGSAGIELPLIRTIGGTPIDSPFAPGVSAATGGSIRLDFNFPDRGTMIIDGTRKPLEKLLFGVAQSMLPPLVMTAGAAPLRFPSLTGRWMLFATADGKITDLRVLDLKPADGQAIEPLLAESVAWRNGETAVPRDDAITLVCGNDRASFIIPFARCFLRGEVFPSLSLGDLLDFSPAEISLGRFDIPIFQIQIVGIPTIEVFALRID